MATIRDSEFEKIEELLAEHAIYETERQSYLDRIAELEYELAAAMAQLLMEKTT